MLTLKCRYHKGTLGPPGGNLHFKPLLRVGQIRSSHMYVDLFLHELILSACLFCVMSVNVDGGVHNVNEEAVQAVGMVQEGRRVDGRGQD